LHATLELPSSGFVFFINKIGKLIKVNDCGKNLLKITDNIPQKKHFFTYCKTEETQQLIELVDRGLITKIPLEQKIRITENMNTSE